MVLACERLLQAASPLNRNKEENKMITITGTVGTSGKYLVTGMPVTTTAHTVLKIAFENNAGGTNLALLAGTLAQFASGTGGTQLSDSGGPGFQFLSIVDTQSLAGQVLFVRRMVGTANAQFVLTIE
jgi:hypothetical protein